MKATPLETPISKVNLIEPDIERDASLGVKWLEGAMGRNTLMLMGVPESTIKPPTLDQEKVRVENFISQPNQLNWMIQYENKVVGSIWVDLIPKERVEAPAIHLMIGDPEAR